MSDVSFDRTDQNPAVQSTVIEHGAKRSNFDRVTERRACAVRFDITDLIRCDLRVRHCLTDHILLGESVRGGQAVTAPILIDSRTADQCKDVVAVTQGVG